TTRPDHALLRVRDNQVVEEVPLQKLGGQIGGMVADPGGGVLLGMANAETKRYRHGQVEPYGPGASPGTKRLRGMFLDSRGLWLLTNQGVSRIRDGHLDTFDTGNGLPCDGVHAAVTSDDGSLWLKTTCGLVQIASRDLDSWSEHPRGPIRVRVLDASDGARAGLPAFNPLATKSRDGRLWFAVEGSG